MTSQINSSFLSTIVGDYPIAGVNNSSQGFRTNFTNIKTGLAIAGNELSYLQGKIVSIVGDATGVSGALGNGPAQPTPIQLTLSDVGVDAGSYSSLNNNLMIEVDSKGRVIFAAVTPRPSDPALNDTFSAYSIPNNSTSSPLVETLNIPSFTFNEYGELTSSGFDTFNFGLIGYDMPKGTLLVGKQENGLTSSSFFQPPASPVSGSTYLLAYDPVGSNTQGLKWFVLPPAPPINPAKVISVVGTNGISVDSLDQANPIVKMDLANLSVYPTSLPINTDSLVVMRDSLTNQEYSLEISRLVQNIPTSTFKVKDDPAPELGGDLYVGSRKITSNNINGLVLQTRDGGDLILENVITQSSLFNPPVPLDPADYVYSRQKFPRQPPTFTASEISSGTNYAYMKIDHNGQMYWSKEDNTTPQGVTSIEPGVGIVMNPIGSITTTGSVNINYQGVVNGKPDVTNDVILAMDVNGSMYKTTIGSATFTLPDVIVVDPVYGNDDLLNNPSRGRLNNPVRTIATALSMLSMSPVNLNYVYLLPGTYNENITISNPNVQLIGMFGQEQTIFRGSVTIDSNTLGKTIFKGISFNITNITTPTGEILTASNGVESLLAEDCSFLCDPTGYDIGGRPSDIITLQGSFTGTVIFNRCMFNGKFTNAMQFAGDDVIDNGFVQLSNITSDGDNILALQTEANTKTMIECAEILWQIIHNGGYLIVSGVKSIQGDFTDAEWDATEALGEDDPFEQGYVPSGIISTANISSKNLLQLENIKMGYTFNGTSPITSKITKTGTCQYSLTNVVRKGALDTLNGTQIDNGGLLLTDLNDQIILSDVNGSYNVNSLYGSTWNLNVTGNSTINLSSAIAVGVSAVDGTALDLVRQAYTVKVFLKQTGSFTVSWAAGSDTIIWDGGTTPALGTGAGKVLLVELVKIGSTWLGRKLVSN